MTQGIVVKSTGSWYTVKTDDGRLLDCKVKGLFRLRGIRSTNPVAVGDHVHVTVAQDGSAYIKEVELAGCIGLPYLRLPERRDLDHDHHLSDPPCGGGGQSVPHRPGPGQQHPHGPGLAAGPGPLPPVRGHPRGRGIRQRPLPHLRHGQRHLPAQGAAPAPAAGSAGDLRGRVGGEDLG